MVFGSNRLLRNSQLQDIQYQAGPAKLDDGDVMPFSPPNKTTKQSYEQTRRRLDDQTINASREIERERKRERE